MKQPKKRGGENVKKTFFTSLMVLLALIFAVMAYAVTAKAEGAAPATAQTSYTDYANARAAAKLAENTGDINAAVNNYLQAEEAAMVLPKNPPEGSKSDWQEIAEWQRNNAAYALIMKYHGQTDASKDRELLQMAAEILDAKQFLNEKVKAKATKNRQYCTEHMK